MKRKVNWLREFEDARREDERRKTVVEFYKVKPTELSKISEVEREFIWNWCERRNLDDIYAVVALTYWVRAKAEIAVNFFFQEENKKLYMLICVHLSLKWLGYDEDHKCDFFADLTDVCREMKPERHRGMEIELLMALNWEM